MRRAKAGSAGPDDRDIDGGGEGHGGLASSEWRMANGWRVANGEWRMANGTSRGAFVYLLFATRHSPFALYSPFAPLLTPLPAAPFRRACGRWRRGIFCAGESIWA